MKKIKYASVLLGCVLFLSGCTSCNSTSKKNNSIVTPNNPEVIGSGIQNISVKTTNIDFIKDGKTDYKVVIPEETTDIVKNAAQELVYFVYEASGISLEVVTDENAAYSSTAKYISFGNTDIAQEANVSVDYSIVGSNGYIIQTQGQSVFCIGGGDYGTLYSTYEFLEHMFGYEIYATDEIVLEKNVKNKRLLDFDITVRPTFQWRHIAFGKVDHDTTQQMRFRELAPNSMFIRVNGAQWVHNSLAYIPYNEENKTNHPEWFSTNAATDPDLCYSNAEVLDIVVEELKDEMIANPTKELVTISSPDGQKNWCKCTACAANYDKYGTNAATMIQFCNKVNARIKQWIAAGGDTEEEAAALGHAVRKIDTGRRLQIVFLGYSQTRTPPVKKEGDKYVPIDNSVVCDDGVSVFLTADVSGGNFLTDPKDEKKRTEAEQWSVLSNKQFSYWIYTENYQHYLPFADSFGAVQSVYQFAAQKNTFFMLDNGQGNPDESTGFCNLKNYLDYEFMWDVNQSYDVLVNNFFDHYFKDAQKPMRQLFDALRMISTYQRDVQKTTLVNFAIEQAEFYPLPFLEKCMGYIDEAYKAIEPLKKKDSALYEKLHNRINVESIAVRYLIIDIYASSYKESEMQDMKMQFKTDAEKLKITHLAETVLISNLWSRWGIA